MRGGVCVWERTEMGESVEQEGIRAGSEDTQQRVYKKSDVFEQDVASRKVTRILDLHHKLLVL